MLTVGDPVHDDSAFLVSFDLQANTFSTPFILKPDFAIHDVVPTGTASQYFAVGKDAHFSWVAILTDN